MQVTKPDPMSVMTSFIRRVAMLFLIATLGACVAPPPAAPASPFEDDVNRATEALVQDLRSRSTLPLFMQRMSPSSVAIGSFVDAPGERVTPAFGFAPPQTIASAKARALVGQRVDAYAPELRRVEGGDAAQAGLLLSARLATPSGIDRNAKELRRQLTLVLTDQRSREVVARWQGPIRIVAGDAFPTQFEMDSPVLANQSAAAVQADAELFNSPPGTRLAPAAVPDAASSALLSQAQSAYGSGDYAQALSLFQRAADSPSADKLRAYNGLYLSYLKLGRERDARKAFKQLVSNGLAARALAVKLLFAPGETSFWSDPSVSGLYGFWLQEIATQAAAAPTCMNVVGHTSHTGAEAFNVQLSLARGEKVMGLLQAAAPRLGTRLGAMGKGWSENLVGSGTDDARDAIDRRVEFRIVECMAKS